MEKIIIRRCCVCEAIELEGEILTREIYNRYYPRLNQLKLVADGYLSRDCFERYSLDIDHMEFEREFCEATSGAKDKLPRLLEILDSEEI